MKVTAHTLVKNEDYWVWYAIQSVLPFVDQIIIFDTGSSDRTVDLIKSIKSPKIIFEEKGPTDAVGLVKLRQEQLDRTKTDWFLIVDGDEMWREDQMKEVLGAIDKADKGKISLVTHSRNAIGDVFHYLPEGAGEYQIGQLRGNLNIRAVRKTPDLKLVGTYPLETYVNNQGALQDQPEQLGFLDEWCLHVSFLKRSSGTERKKSGSLGKSKTSERGLLMMERELPEVLKHHHPLGLFNPLMKRSSLYEFKAAVTTPLLNLKRKLK